jgi:competence protein ComEC
MKQLKTLLFFTILIFLTSCTQKGKINIQVGEVALRLQDTYQLTPTSEKTQDFLYRSENPVVLVDKEGLVTGNSIGTGVVIISAKGHQEVEIPFEVISGEDQLKVFFIDVGQADSTLIILPNKETILIDAGLDHNSTMGDGDFPSWNNIQRVLSEQNVKTINHLIISHNHSDHYYFIPEIVEGYDVKNVYTSGSTNPNKQYQYIMQSIKDAGLFVHVVGVGDKIIGEKYLTFQVVATKNVKNEDNPNYSSIITRLQFYNKSFLFTGDAGSARGDGEEAALNSGLTLKSDVLKVGHHGSSLSSNARFLNAVMPKYAVITTANITTTGHPHNSALLRIKNTGATIYQSKDNGTITFVTDGFDIQLKTEK